MPLIIIRNDITKVRADAIVNAANTSLKMGGGVCGAIFDAAGADRLQAACDKLAPIKTGEAVITKGFKLPAKYIIHTAGPVYRGGEHGEEDLLRSCYINSLNTAVKNRCESIAFPLISSGIYGYPKTEALRVAVNAIRGFITEHDIDVSLVVFDKTAFAISRELLGAVENYIDGHYDKYFKCGESIDETDIRPEDATLSRRISNQTEYYAEFASSIEGIEEIEVYKLDESFSKTLMRLIDATGKKDSEVYRRANIDRRLFSKIRSNANYAPSKPTVLAFAVALELELDQTADLLKRAGFALSHSVMFDVIIEYFIIHRKYDVFEINEVLFSYDQPLLGG